MTAHIHRAPPVLLIAIKTSSCEACHRLLGAAVRRKLARGFDDAMPFLLTTLHGVAEVVQDDYGPFIRRRRAGQHGADTGDMCARWRGIAEQVVPDKVVREEFPLRLLGRRPGVSEVGVAGEGGGGVDVETSG